MQKRHVNHPDGFRAGLRQQRGFTLMEMMVALAIAAIIFAIGAPSFAEFRRNSRLAGAANDFLGAIQTARSEAIKRQISVSICPSNDPGAANPTCTTGNFTGWIVFAEAATDLNCQRTNTSLPAFLLPDGTEIIPLETDARNLIRADGPIDSGIVIRSNGNCLSFAPSGFLQNVPGRTTAAFTFLWDAAFPTTGRCGAQPGAPAQSRARAVEVTNTGRSRVTRLLADVSADLALPNVSSVVTCP